MSMTMNKGYQMFCVPRHPRAWANGYVYAHLLFAEKAIGRPLGKGECVHHINEDKCNNSPENLRVVLRSEHAAVHRGGDCIVVKCLVCESEFSRSRKQVTRESTEGNERHFCNVLCQGRFALRDTE